MAKFEYHWRWREQAGWSSMERWVFAKALAEALGNLCNAPFDGDTGERCWHVNDQMDIRIRVKR